MAQVFLGVVEYQRTQDAFRKLGDIHSAAPSYLYKQKGRLCRLKRSTLSTNLGTVETRAPYVTHCYAQVDAHAC